MVSTSETQRSCLSSFCIWDRASHISFYLLYNCWSIANSEILLMILLLLLLLVLDIFRILLILIHFLCNVLILKTINIFNFNSTNFGWWFSSPLFFLFMVAALSVIVFANIFSFSYHFLGKYVCWYYCFHQDGLYFRLCSGIYIFKFDEINHIYKSIL